MRIPAESSVSYIGGMEPNEEETELEARAGKRARDREYNRLNQARISERRKAFRLLNKEKIREQQRASIAKNPEKYRDRERAWREANPGRDNAYGARWREKHGERAVALRKASQLRYRERKQADPAWVLRRRISARMLRSLKSIGGKRRRGWEELVGYTLADLRAHIERKFQPGMTWENMGEWHIDHRRPVSSFQITTVDDPDFLKCWALSNLQPLWATENLKKYNKFVGLIPRPDAGDEQ